MGIKKLDDLNSEIDSEFSKVSVAFEDGVPFDFSNILIVEDDPSTSKYLKHTIQKASHDMVRIKSVNSSQKACEYIYNLKQFGMPGPDLAIIDYILADGKDGLWLCDLMKKRFPETQVVLTSSLSPEKIKEKINQSLTRPLFIQKPFETNKIKNFLL